MTHNRDGNSKGLIYGAANHLEWGGAPPSWENYGRHDQELVLTARRSGFSVPDMVCGVYEAHDKPSSGRIDDTRVKGSVGTTVVLNEARRASPQKPLVIVSGGPLTTVADAYLSDHSVAGNIVVLWGLGYAGIGGNGCPTGSEANSEMGSWSNTIVMSRIRTVIFPAGMFLPYTPKSRMRSDLRDCPLRQAMLDRFEYTRDHDADAQGAVAYMAGSRYVKSYTRCRVSPDRFFRYGAPQLEPDNSGLVYYVTNCDTQAGTDEWWRAVLKAFATPTAAGGRTERDQVPAYTVAFSVPEAGVRRVGYTLGPGPWTLTLADVSGRQVVQTRVHGGSAWTVDLGCRAPGAYLLHVRGAGPDVTERLLVR